jgi:3',5'-cyclic-AMP phosphodiesterase
LARPYLLGQLSDLHLGKKPKDGVDPTSSLEAVLAGLSRLPNRLDAIVVTGDVAHYGKRKEYRLARELLDATGVPVHVMPGNHDDRAKLREAFALPGEGDAPIDYEVDLGPLALVVVDSTAPGEEEPGRFTLAQLKRLDRVLTDLGEKPTIVAMHHSPLPTAMPGWDGANLIPAEDRALAEVIARHPQVRLIIGGHLHRDPRRPPRPLRPEHLPPGPPQLRHRAGRDVHRRPRLRPPRLQRWRPLLPGGDSDLPLIPYSHTL